jgi:hypothetical protein
MYTSTSATNSGEDRQKPSTFSGKILLHVDFILKRKTIRLLRQGANLPSDAGGTLERLANAIEDAFLAAVMDRLAAWPPVSFDGDFQCSREPYLFNGDIQLPRLRVDHRREPSASIVRPGRGLGRSRGGKRDPRRLRAAGRRDL